MTDNQLIALAGWTYGDLRYKYKPIQVMFTKAWERAKLVSRKFVLRATRRGMKSSWLLLTDFEDCIKRKNFQAAFVAPVEVSLEDYIQQISARLMEDCPPELKPVWKSGDSQFYFPRSNSTIFCAGSNSKSYNRLRGYRFDRADVDEAAYHTDLRELVEGVLTPTCFDSNGYIRLSSSAPELADHPFDDYWDRAVAGGFGAEFDIHQAKYPVAQVEEWVKEMGGWQAPVVQREFMCRTVIDPERRIIPEWDDRFTDVPPRDEYFPFYHKYGFLDTGVRDDTFNGLGYYDFKRAMAVVDDEIVLRGAQVRTDILAAEVKRKEALYYGSQMHRRVADNNNLIIIQDLTGPLHGLSYVPTTKDDLFAMVNEVRLWVSAGRLRVNPRCKYLIGCLKNGVWDKNKKEFARSATWGHFDGLAALCYWLRHIDEHTNPIPPLFKTSDQTHHIPQGASEPANYKAMREALGVRKIQRTTDDWRNR